MTYGNPDNVWVKVAIGMRLMSLLTPRPIRGIIQSLHVASFSGYIRDVEFCGSAASSGF